MKTTNATSDIDFKLPSFFIQREMIERVDSGAGDTGIMGAGDGDKGGGGRG